MPETITVTVYKVPVRLQRLIRAEAGKHGMSMSKFIKQLMVKWAKNKERK